MTGTSSGHSPGRAPDPAPGHVTGLTAGHAAAPANGQPAGQAPGQDRGFRTVGVDEAFDFAARQLRRLLQRAGDGTATYTEHGRWVLDTDRWAPSWSGGFIAGQVWAVALRTGDPWWRRQAEHRTAILEPRKLDTGTHDLGFILEPSFGRWYDLDHDRHARDVLITGGRTMALRLQTPGGYLRTWVDAGSTFIDVMMNVGLIFRAAEYSGDVTLADAAATHCRTSRRYLVRGDGSTLHEGWFDTTTGEFLHAATHQGRRGDSTWARGQAWAIYGFASAFGHTGDRALLATSCAAADYYIEQTGPDGVPPNDFTDPGPAPARESSAAAIAAAGMLRLAGRLADTGELAAAAGYRSYAEQILSTLRSTQYIAVDVPGWEGILRHGTYHRRNGLGVDESVMWGDYYFLEALELAGEEPHPGSGGGGGRGGRPPRADQEAPRRARPPRDCPEQERVQQERA